MFRTDLDIEQLKYSYNKNKYVVIDNFLEECFAEDIYNGLQELTKKNLWYQSNYGNPRYVGKDLKLDLNSPDNITYSYSFERFPLVGFRLTDILSCDSRRKELNALVDNNYPERELENEHPLRKVGELMNSDEIHDLVKTIISKELTYNKAQCFASRFTAGDFISIHNDRGVGKSSPRKVAFLLNMTKNWAIHWGGNLVIVDDACKNIIEAFVPSFNKLVLMDVATIHAVLPVFMYCQESRFSITGTFYKY